MNRITPDRAHAALCGGHFVLFNAALGLAHVLVLFNAGSYVALLPHAAGNLGGVLPSFATWAQTDFLISLALGFPIARWLSCRFGEYRTFAAAFLVYAAASALCAVSESVGLFLPSRILLGLAGGVTLPLGQTLLLAEYPDHRKSQGLAVWGLFTIMPFTVGFATGGWIADEFGWRALFMWNVPLALWVAGSTWALLHGRPCEARREQFDLVGFLLLALILGGTQTILNQGNDFDWFDSPFLRMVLAAVAVAMPCWIIWELGAAQPAVDLRLFRHRNFAVGLVCLALGFLSVQGLLALFVVQLQLLMGYSSSLAGMVFFPMIVLGVPMVAIMHEVAKRVDVRILVCLNCLGFAGTFYWIGLFDDPQSFDQIFWPMIIEGLFLGSFFAPLTVLTLQGLTGHQMMRAAEAANVFRIAAGAIGITWEEVVVFRRVPFHQLHLADHFGGRVSASLDVVQEVWSKFERAGLEAGMIQRKLELLIKQQAGILALNDAFLLSSYLCLGLAFLVWLAESNHAPAAAGQEAVRELQAEELMEQP